MGVDVHPGSELPPPDAPSPELIELARAFRVATEFWDWRGTYRPVSARTIVAALGALDVDASTPEAIASAHADVDERPWRRLLPATVVMISGTGAQLMVHVHHGDPVSVWAELEDGVDRWALPQVDRWVEPRLVDGDVIGEATFWLPAQLPIGYHTLRAHHPGGEGTCPLVVTPARLELPATLRDAAELGVHDPAVLVALAAVVGAWVISPISATWPHGAPPSTTPSSCSSTRSTRPSRWHRWSRRPTGPRRAGSPTRCTCASRTFPRSPICRPRTALSWRSTRRRCDRSHTTPTHWTATGSGRPSGQPSSSSTTSRGTNRDNAASMRSATVKAKVCATLRRGARSPSSFGLPSSTWPDDVRDPTSTRVEVLRDELAGRVRFYEWLQWCLDEQLAAAQRAAVEAGMTIGVVHDLAVGVHPDGADPWALSNTLASGVSVGAPPDAFNQLGQDWLMRPWRPDRLAELGYAPYRDMMRTILRNAGGLRIDHVIGLFRLWWVPPGCRPSEGTYVGYDHEALVGILVLEAHRAGAVVVGEDLGTVEPWTRDYLRQRGILGTSVLWFEKDPAGEPLAPDQWREMCLATVTTHDLPPTAGYLAGEHIDLRERLGLLTRPVAEERRADDADRRAVLAECRDLGLLGDNAHIATPGEQDQIEALHRLLTLTPARLVGVSVADAVGDRRTINQPGTVDEYPNWRVPLADGDGHPLLLEDVVASDRARSLAETVRQR